MSAPTPAIRSRRLELAVRLACAAALVALALWETGNFARERRRTVEAWQARLTAMADDRERAVESWLGERRRDLELVATYPSVRALLAGHGEVDRRLREILQSTVDGGPFTSFVLFERSGIRRLELGEQPLPTAGLPAGWETGELASGAPRIAMARDASGRPLLLFVAPVVAEPAAESGVEVDGEQRVGAVVAAADPARWLFALLEREPAPTETGESLLVTRERGRIVYSSPRRHQAAGWEPEGGPGGRRDSAAEAALAGEARVGELTDYRGAATLVAVRRLHEAPWGLLVKIDRREALAEWRDAMARRLATWAVATLAALLLLWGLRRSRRLRSLQETAGRDAKYRLLMEQAGDAILFVRPDDGRILEANRAAERMYGRSGEQLRTLSVLDLRAPAERGEGPAALAAAGALESPGRLVQETVHVDASGHAFPVEVSVGPAEVGGEKVLLEVVRDTRERWAAIERIERLNRKLSTTSQINQLIVHEREPGRLLREACRIFVDSAGLRMAWVGRLLGATATSPARLVPVAWAGLESGYLATAELPLDEPNLGPARQAVLAGRAVTRSGEGARPEAWSRAADERGYRSSAAVPMRRAGQVVGVLAAYSELPDFFRDDILAMLEELAADLELAVSAAEAEEALAESAARYRSLFESSPQPMWVYDLETLRFLAVNDAAVGCYGWSREEFLAMGLADVRPTEDVPALHDNVAGVVDGYGDAGVWRHRRKDGREILVRITSHTLEFEDRRAEMVLATDVTEQRRAEAELQRTHELLRGVVEQSPAPIYTLSPTGEVTSWNRAAEQVFGWTAAEALGRVLPIVQAEAEPHFRALMARLLAGDAFRDIEAVRRRRDGSEIVLDLAAAPLRGSGGGVVGIVAVANDVTARKRAEEEARQLALELEDRVRQRTAELEAANRELEAFTYSVSHDLRAPLRTIEGFATLLEKDQGEQLGEEGRQRLRELRRNAQRIGALVTDLLALSRAGRKGLTPGRVAMRPLAAAALLELLPAGGDVEVVWGALPDAWGDSSLLRQVWVNLISNALKFSGERAERRIEIGGEIGGESGGESAGAEVRYHVRDNGIGFSREDAEGLFGVFQRLPGSERFEGNGVGLALVQRVVTRHGGRVWAEATPGEGACFYFTLPAPS